MALDFPPAPTSGQTHPSPPVAGQPVYKWDGEKWIAVVAAASVPPVIINENFGGYINKIRNGTFDIWQRGTSKTITNAYYADGWHVAASGAAVTVTRAVNNRAGANTNYCMNIEGNGGVTNTDIRHRIEGDIAVALAGKTVTFQAQVFNNTGADITPQFSTSVPNARDNWTAVATDIPVTALQPCVNGQWTRVAFTFVVSANAGRGYALAFPLGGVLNTNAKSLTLAEVDLRITDGVTVGLNVVPPKPEMRPVATEQMYCERYFRWLGFAMWFLPGYAGEILSTQISFPAMRVIPTVSALAVDPNVSQAATNVQSSTISGATPYSAACTMIAVTALTYTNQSGFRSSASAEL